MLSPLKILSKILIVLAFVFIIKTFSTVDFQSMQISWAQIALIAPVFILLYVFILFCGALGWKTILTFVTQTRLNFFQVIPIFLKSNIAKYVPGNVFEFVARNALSTRYHWKHSDVVMSSILEMLLALIAFSSIIGFILVFGEITLPPSLQEILNARLQEFRSKLYVVAAFAFAFLSSLYFLRDKLAFIEQHLKLLRSRAAIKASIKYLLISLFILVSSSALFAITLAALFPETFLWRDANDIIAYFLISSFIGYIVPGAPGGLGIRESVLVFFLGPQFGEGNILIGALLHRILSILGDVCGYGLALLLERMRSNDQEFSSAAQFKNNRFK